MKASSMQPSNPISIVPVFTTSFMVAGSFSAFQLFREIPCGRKAEPTRKHANQHQNNEDGDGNDNNNNTDEYRVERYKRTFENFSSLLLFLFLGLTQTITGPDQAEFIFNIGGSGVLFILPVWGRG